MKIQKLPLTALLAGLFCFLSCQTRQSEPDINDKDVVWVAESRFVLDFEDSERVRVSKNLLGYTSPAFPAHEASGGVISEARGQVVSRNPSGGAISRNPKSGGVLSSENPMDISLLPYWLVDKVLNGEIPAYALQKEREEVNWSAIIKLEALKQTIIDSFYSPNTRMVVLQDWYFNRKTHKLETKIKGVAPVWSIYDRYGKNIIRSDILFYVKME